MVPYLDPALLSLYHAQSERTWMANIVEAVEATLEEADCIGASTIPPRCASSTSVASPG